MEKDKGIIGQMQVAAIEMGWSGSESKIFLWIFEENMMVFSEEKKIRENRSDEKEKGRVDRDREREGSRRVAGMSERR